MCAAPPAAKMDGVGQTWVPPAPVMTPAEDGPRRVQREPTHRVLGGVASGLAVHLGLPTPRARWFIRALFALVTPAGGLGAVLYIAYWIVLPLREQTGPRQRLQTVAQVSAAVVVGAVVGFAVIRGNSFSRFLLPVLLAAIGGALVWRQASETERERWRRLSTTSLTSAYGDRAGVARLVGGIALVIAGGVIVLATSSSLGDLRDSFTVLIVVVLGLGLITGPYWMRAVTSLADERRARIRAQEREEIAAHLHDSVLQTLALIQRNAGSPREVTRLARGQERELRTLLYRDRPTGTLASALHDAVGEVEDGFAITVDEVVVGDVPLDESSWALVQAAREAMVNAGKHAGVETISLYAEVEETEIVVFVRDRGRGFDPADVPDDRQGLRGSVMGRLDRHRGRAEIRSGDTGTEVELHMPRVG